MNTIDAMRLFCDGQTSVHDIRALILSMGHSEEEFVAAFAEILSDAEVRFRRPTKEEFYSEFYLNLGG